ncbi:MAG: MarC family protein [Candidatus Woesearchaeota archaeon]
MIAELINILLVMQIFTLLNPLSSLPMLFMAYKNKLNVKRVSIQAVILALIIAITMILIGPLMFKLFGISINAFRIAGGVVLFLLGIDTIREKEEEEVEKAKPADSIIAIIATPMLTGPATISFLTIKTIEIGFIHVFLNLLIAFVLVFIVFYLLASMIPKLNRTIVGILSRILGLFLTAMALEMMFNGLKGIFLI